ncbi:MAG TPA: 2OG-Fe(II) oxygenase [Pyrinomonadaceae bacterium]
MITREGRVVGRTGSSIGAELSTTMLRQLLMGEVACIWHRQWYDVTQITSELQKLYDLGIRSVPDGTGVRSIGPQVGSAFISESSAKNYFAEAQIFWNQVRTEIFARFVNPIDALFDAINDVWPAGATAGKHDNDTFSLGVFRWFSQGSSLNPHVDTVTESLIAPLCRATRLAANIYLDTTSTINGGHLELWDLSLTPDQFELARAPDFSLRREMIGPPILSISPEPGDLILFDAERIHAVSTILNGTRLTASTFVGFSRLDGPLSFFA